MSDAKATDDDVNQGDDEDNDDNDVVDDVGRSLIGFVVDIQAANDEEEHTHNDLKIVWLDSTFQRIGQTKSTLRFCVFS